MPGIHQFVAGFARGDAITNEALALRDIFRRWGCRSEIFCETRRILPELRREARNAVDYAAHSEEGDIAILHLSIGSDVNDLFASCSARKAILYHNITPPEYFRLIQKETSRSLERGRRQMRELAGRATVNLAVSAFNARELTDAGYANVAVLPLVLDLDKLRQGRDAGIAARFNDGRTNVLCVGRCAPNKRLEDALLCFAAFQKNVDGNARFIHVGSYAGTEPYYHLLLTMARKLRLQNIHFAGAVPQAQLNSFYACSRVFLCTSEHEGFCIPLLESMVHDVPVLARAAAAVPETLAGAGVLFDAPRPEPVAEMIGLLAHDETLRAGVLRRQRSRLRDYEARDLESELKGHLRPML